VSLFFITSLCVFYARLFIQVVSVLSVFFIIVSILSFCLKTHPSMRVPVIRSTQYNVTGAGGGGGGASPSNSAIRSGWLLEKRRTEPHAAFFHFECACNAWFTFELIMRWVTATTIYCWFMKISNRTVDISMYVCMYQVFI